MASRGPGRPKKIPITEDTKTYKCLKCGIEHVNPVNKFYKTTSKLYKANDGYCAICNECIREVFDEFTKRYDEATAVKIICHYLDVPFYYSLYSNVSKKSDSFTIGRYLRRMNNTQYRGRSFVNTLLDRKELGIDAREFEGIKEEGWTISETRNKNNVIAVIGYDPFEGYDESQRKFLFNNITGYLQEDGIEDDQYKISQIIQLVNNNYQIFQCDQAMSRLNPRIDTIDYKSLSEFKKNLVTGNDKIAKENGISVKNRLDQTAGRSTLTYLMKHLRELNVPEAEANYYNQLKGEGSQWAANMSLKAIRENGFFDENDFKDIVEDQYRKIQELTKKLDDIEEENRLLLIENDELKAGDSDE